MGLPKRYVPKHLSRRDKSRQKKMIRRSKRLYKRGKYYSRKKLKSFKSKFIDYFTPVDPKPPDPLSVSPKFLTSLSLALTIGHKTI